MYGEGFCFLGGFSLFLFISFFNQNPDVIAIGVDRAKICAFFYVLLGFSHVASSLLRGLGRPVMQWWSCLYVGVLFVWLF